MRKKKELDQVDVAIVEELKRDGRATNRALAEAVGVSEQTIAARMQRLEESKALKVIAVVSRSLHGYNSRVHFGIQTGGRSPRQVATQLAKIPNVIALTICLGHYEIFGVLLAKNNRETLDVITKQFGAVKGIEKLDLFVDVEHVQYTLDFSSLRGSGSRVPSLPLRLDPASNGLDEGDLSVVREIMKDARVSFREIGRRLNVSESFVRGRIREMQDNRILRFQAISDVSTNPNPWAAYVALIAEPSAVTRIGQTLANSPRCTSVTLVLGHFNIIATIHAPTHEELADAIFEDLGRVEGIHSLEAWAVVEAIKQDNTLLATDI